MARIFTFLAMISFALLGFHFAGLITDTPISLLLNGLLNPQNLADSSFILQMAGSLALVAVAGIVIGSLSPQRTQWVLATSIASFLFLIGWEIIGLINVLYQVNPTIALLIGSPILLLFGFSVYEWWLGKD